MKDFSRSDEAWDICMELLFIDGLPEDAVHSLHIRSIASQHKHSKRRCASTSPLIYLWRKTSRLNSGIASQVSIAETGLIDISPSRPPNVNRFLCHALAMYVMHIFNHKEDLQAVMKELLPNEFTSSQMHKFISAIRMIEEMPNIAYREDIVVDLERQSGFKRMLKAEAGWVLNFFE